MLRIEPVTAALCMYWRLGPSYRHTGREKNKAALRRLVRNGPPPGLLALDGPGRRPPQPAEAHRSNTAAA
jgi:hypothetical protein